MIEGLEPSASFQKKWNEALVSSFVYQRWGLDADLIE